MRPDFVVAFDPVVGDLSHLGEGVEQVSTKHLLAIRAIESLDEGVLVRLAGLDESNLDALHRAPFSEPVAGQLRSVVAPDGTRLTVDLDELIQEAGHARRRDTR